MGKYEPLPQFLAATGGSKKTMSFAQIERVLGFPLPKSAYEYEAWWSNNAAGHSHARAWVEAGWKTESVNLAERKVTFLRGINANEMKKSSPKRDPWGCMAGTVTILPGTDLTAPSGEIWNAEEGRFLNE